VLFSGQEEVLVVDEEDEGEQWKLVCTSLFELLLF